MKPSRAIHPADFMPLDVYRRCAYLAKFHELDGIVSTEQRERLATLAAVLAEMEWDSRHRNPPGDSGRLLLIAEVPR